MRTLQIVVHSDQKLSLSSFVNGRLTGVDRGIRDITNGSALYDVSHCESLDSLVLGNTSSTVAASDKGN
jgi:hypothetical protein